MINRNEQRVCNGNNGFLLAPTNDQALILSTKERIGVPYCGPCALNQSCLESLVCPSGVPVFALACRLVVAGANTGPGGEMSGRGKSTHVLADLGYGHLGAHTGDAGNWQ